MRELSNIELSNVAGGDLAGAIFGLFDGASTGMSIGGKWGGAGGFGFGALSQLVGLIVPTAMGGIFGFVTGAMSDTQTVSTILSDYRHSFGPGDVNHGGTIG